MKPKIIPFLSLLFLVASLQSCMKDQCEREITYVKAIPVHQSWEEIRIDIQSEAPRALENPGKIYFYEHYIFINEKRTGVHVIDNSDPENPMEISFIPIPGNVDIAIRNQILYADNYTDLLAIDISDINQVRLAKRVEEVFPHFGVSAQGVLTHFDQQEVTEIVDCNSNLGRSNNPVFALEDAAFDNNAGVQAPTGNLAVADGLGGSFARFTLYDQYLYIVGEQNMDVFDISQNNCPEHLSELPVGWNIETIYPFKDHLFLGSSNGMFIYDLVNPASPQYVSEYWHWTGCDPIFAKDNYAYVTIRTGTNCNGGSINQLQLIDITDIRNPFAEEVFDMQNPHGLSIRENALYLCEGEFGLKVFDIENPRELDRNQLAHLTDMAAYDVINIPGDQKILLLIGVDGFYQFDVANPDQPQLLSHLPVAIR